MLSIKGGDKMPAFNRRHGVLALALFIIVAIWFSHDTVSENLPNIKVPSMLHGHDDRLNGTLERFWTNKNTYLSDTPYWERPLEVRKIMGLVFYGRRNTVSILDCYLKRNLVKNGGSLDGVVFVVRTTDKEDLDLLKKMMDSEPAYETTNVDLKGKDNFANGFGNSYEGIEDDILYIKMDDDIVFMEDSVIPSLIQTRLAHPEYYTVSANIVNQPLISWLHWNLGAVHPFLPEVNDKSETILHHKNKSEIGWKTSTLPSWKGPNNFKALDWDPSDQGLHRWLPLRRKGAHILDNTPIEKTEYDAFGPGWTKWQIGAQEHYSFLENLEKNELHQYKFAIWDFQYKRMGIQFLALMGKDINIAKPIPGDDENHFSCEMTKKLGRHAVIDGRGVAVHWSFGSQRNGMRWADVLERYRNFAIENICASPMLWQPK